MNIRYHTHDVRAPVCTVPEGGGQYQYNLYGDMRTAYNTLSFYVQWNFVEKFKAHFMLTLCHQLHAFFKQQQL